MTGLCACQQENRLAAQGCTVTMPLERKEKNFFQTGPEQTVGASSLVDSLFREHWERLCLVVYRLVGDWQEAEDLALEAFYQLHQQPGGGNQLTSPGGWLYRVATNLGLNALRARQRRRGYENQAASLELFERSSENPAQVTERREEHEQVRQVLRQMPLQNAQLLLLRHTGFSYQELAEALQIAPASIGTLLARAEKQFAELYRKTTS